MVGKLDMRLIDGNVFQNIDTEIGNSLNLFRQCNEGSTQKLFAIDTRRTILRHDGANSFSTFYIVYKYANIYKVSHNLRLQVIILS